MNKRTIQYLRPETLGAALDIKREFGDKAKVLFGGNFKPTVDDTIEVLIDLQNTPLDMFVWDDEGFHIGGLVNLRDLAVGLELPDFDEALSIEYGMNVRNSFSITNYLAQAIGRSPILCCLLALDAEVFTLADDEPMSLLEYLRNAKQDDFVIELNIPGTDNLAFESVGRSPKDLPIVCVAASKVSENEISVAVGGTAEVKDSFTIADFDDDGSAKIEAAFEGATDGWASAEYRQDVAKILLSRVLQKLQLQTRNEE